MSYNCTTSSADQSLQSSTLGEEEGSTCRSLNGKYTRTYTYHNHTACTIKRIMQTCSYSHAIKNRANPLHVDKFTILKYSVNHTFAIQNPHTAPLPLRMVESPTLRPSRRGKVVPGKTYRRLLCDRGQHAMLFTNGTVSSPRVYTCT